MTLPSMTMWLGLTWLVATVKILFVSFAHIQFMEGYLPLLGRPITMLGALASMSSDACGASVGMRVTINYNLPLTELPGAGPALEELVGRWSGMFIRR